MCVAISVVFLCVMYTCLHCGVYVCVCVVYACLHCGVYVCVWRFCVFCMRVCIVVYMAISVVFALWCVCVAISVVY